MEGSPVYTTAEIAVGELTALAFSRELDPKTTYRELAIRKRGEEIHGTNLLHPPDPTVC